MQSRNKFNQSNFKVMNIHHYNKRSDAYNAITEDMWYREDKELFRFEISTDDPFTTTDIFYYDEYDE